jgi:hypothetical protein
MSKYHMKAWYGTGIVLTSPQDHWMISQGSVDSWSENDEKNNFGPIGCCENKISKISSQTLVGEERGEWERVGGW